MQYFALYLSPIIARKYFTEEKEKYLTHWLCLVEAIHVLSSQEIPLLGLDRSETCLKIFVVQMGYLYSREFCTLQIHMLIHLVLQGKSC